MDILVDAGLAQKLSSNLRNLLMLTVGEKKKNTKPDENKGGGFPTW